jgi:integrase
LEGVAQLGRARRCPSRALHDLRHTTATVTLVHRIDVRTVADVLGRADVSTTLRTYVHSTEDAARRAADTMGAALG